MSKPIAMQILSREVDPNGNVPRLLAVYSPAGNVVDLATIDSGSIPAYYRDVLRLPDMQLTKKDFKEWLYLQKERAKEV